jgi:Ca2+-binding RTX toxin-like protein
MHKLSTRALGVSAGLVVLLAPSPALASSVFVTPANVLTYVAAPGEVNDVKLTQGLGAIKIHDAGATIAAGTGCQSTGQTAVCSTQGLVRVAVAASDGDDSVKANLTLTATLGGESGNDTLIGGAEDDKLDGGTGDDTLDPGFGNDTVKGGEDTDTVTYAARTERVSVSIDNPVADGQAGENDDVQSTVENAITGAGNDQLSGPRGQANVLNGGPGRDRVTYIDRTAGVGVSLDGIANDGEPNEHDNAIAIEDITGTGHIDLLVGNDEPNTISAGSGLDLVFGLGGDDHLSGGNDDDGLIAGAGDDVLEGGLGDDTLAGEGGDDTLDGGFGEDDLAGGADVDIATYAARAQRVAVTFDNAANDGESGESDNVRTDIENATGGHGDDHLRVPLFDVNGSPVPGAHTLDGGPGDDTLLGFATLLGGDDDDLLSGGPTQRGGGGNDELDGTGLNGDSLDGGPGDDVLDGGHGGDDLVGGPGTDRAEFERIGAVDVTLNDVRDDVAGSGDFDNVHSDIEDLRGTPGDDVLEGNDGPNELEGFGGDDTIRGLGGNDVLRAHLGVDTLVGGDGEDTIDAGEQHDTISALDGEPDDVFCGTSDDDDVLFDKGLDTLTGDCN